ncbi:RluA family pseudouridine synthase [Buchnera aphidicola]|uniref:RluA family pseudouridine synthase n=1 Tax=Buchnera aphidicola TaxID=9 RepID=UPI0016515D01|nr:RluA family pseudouridine synthase [Buchnera aphidicola]
MSGKKKDKIFSIFDHVIKIVYEDKYILIINKPAGLVVHPGSGNINGTLMDILSLKKKYLINIPRSGIVHRLDKNTTGLMIIAKNIFTYFKLVNLIKYRNIIREYDAFVIGNVVSGGTVSIPISRNKKKRVCMMSNKNGKPSITHFKIIQKFHASTHVRLKLETGRTHQIRVHMLHIKHPILGDPVYKLGCSFPKNITKCAYQMNLLDRQALHASHIKFLHPITNILVDCYIPLPKDMIYLMNYL